MCVFFLAQEQSFDDTLISSLLSSRVLNAVVCKSPMLEQRLMALNIICKKLRDIGTKAIRGTRSYGLNFPKKLFVHYLIVFPPQHVESATPDSCIFLTFSRF